MQTPYDWITVAIFAGLVVLFLQRSTGSETEEEDQSIIMYLIPGVSCAAANYFGNKGQDLVAITLIGLTLAFVIHFLQPFKSWPKS